MQIIEIQESVLVSLLQTLGKFSVRRSSSVLRAFCVSGYPRPPQRMCPALYCRVRRRNFPFVPDFFEIISGGRMRRVSDVPPGLWINTFAIPGFPLPLRCTQGQGHPGLFSCVPSGNFAHHRSPHFQGRFLHSASPSTSSGSGSE